MKLQIKHSQTPIVMPTKRFNLPYLFKEKKKRFPTRKQSIQLSCVSNGKPLDGAKVAYEPR